MHTPGMYVAAILLSAGQHSVHLCVKSPSTNVNYHLSGWKNSPAIHCEEGNSRNIGDITQRGVLYVLFTVHHVLSVMISHELSNYMYTYGVNK